MATMRQLRMVSTSLDVGSDAHLRRLYPLFSESSSSPLVTRQHEYVEDPIGQLKNMVIEILKPPSPQRFPAPKDLNTLTPKCSE